LRAEPQHGAINLSKFLKTLPYQLLIPVAIFLGLAPFVPQPHLWQKLTMLLAGDLTKPLDIFDLLLHATPVVLLVAKVIVERREDGPSQNAS